MRIIVIILLVIIVLLLAVWGTLAIYYSSLPGAALLAGVFAIGSACAFLLLPNRRRTLLCFLALFAVVVGLVVFD